MNSNRGMFKIFFFIILSIAGIFYFKRTEPFLQKKELTKLRFQINISSNERQKEIASEAQNFARIMKEKGFEIQISYATPEQEREIENISEWDILLANSMHAIVSQKKHLGLFKIIAAKKDCFIGTHLLIKNSSSIREIRQLDQRKVYIFSQGVVNPLLLKTVIDSKAANFEVINDQNVLKNKLETERDFALLTNYSSEEENRKYTGLRELYASSFTIPCKFLMISSVVPKTVFDKFIQNVNFEMTPILKNFKKISDEDVSKIFKSFPWKEMKLLRTELRNKK